MTPIQFKEQTVIIAKDQPEYISLPAHVFNDEPGRVAFCWKLSLMERVKILFTGLMWHSVMTFNQPLQPQLPSVDKPKMGD